MALQGISGGQLMANEWLPVGAGEEGAVERHNLHLVCSKRQQVAILLSPGYCAGVPFEMQAREGVATLIRQALGANFTARDVLAFSTMEAVGLLHALNMCVR